MTLEYHLQYFGPLKNEHVDWPDGSVSVYRITGDQIADRVVRDGLVKPEQGPAYYGGDVIARHSWCGYVGSFKSLDEAAAAIAEDRATQKPKATA
jgi:hypothetical protein